jgi:UbiD family decarboxylase
MSVGSNRQAGDLRDFVDELDALGEIKRFEGADCDLEIGALTEIMADRNGPAPLFEKIKGFPAGYRMLANPIGGRRRMALALGLDPHGTGIELLDQWRRNFREMKPIPPSRVNTGPVLENVAEGNDVDLASFPAPRWHEQDGGPYLGTGCSIITRDPDNGDVNIGTYRCMTQSRNTISVKMNKGKHGRLAMQKYHAAGKPCPLAISLGQNPQVYMASQLPVPLGMDEYGVAGWLQNAPVEVVESAHTGLPLPADGEVVLEGEIPPYVEGDLPKEGPFGEWPGYYADTTVGEVPVMVVKRIYYRNDPIIIGAPPLKAPNNLQALPLGASMLWDQLEKAGIPNVTGVWGHVYGSQAGLFIVVSIKQAYAGHSKQALLVAAGARAGAYGGKFVVVVDDDVDVTNLGDVIWALSTRCTGRESIDIVKSVWTSPGDPAIAPHLRNSKGYTMDRILIDACRPYLWLDEFPKANAFSPQAKKQYIERWGL